MIAYLMRFQNHILTDAKTRKETFNKDNVV